MMDSRDLLSLLCAVVLAAPAVAVAVLGIRMLWRPPPSERFITRLTGPSLVLSLLCSVAVIGGMLVLDVDQVVVHFGAWFSVGAYSFEATLLLDRLSLPFVVLVCALTGVVGRFSARYLHRDPGHARFYLLLLVFAAGMLLLVMAGSIDLLFAGWEAVGISSALLIAFFRRRRDPVQNGLRAFAVYRVCDVGLLVAAVLVHHYAHSSEFDTAFGHGHWPDGLAHLEGGAATLVGLLLVLAAMGKSAQVPFGGWLPRAMEGPTPSSAIFYGGLSIHAGAYLLLRTAPVLDRSPVAEGALVAIGLVTAIYATLVGRVQADAKNQLAYAAMAQVGLILAEIGLGLRMLALVHIAGHACVRTLQLLRAPSLLHEFHRIHGAAGGHLPETGLHFEMLVPPRIRHWLYGLSLQRGAMDAVLDRLLVAPLLGLASGLDRLERRWTSLFDPTRSEVPEAGGEPAPVPVARKEVER